MAEDRRTAEEQDAVRCVECGHLHYVPDWQNVERSHYVECPVVGCDCTGQGSREIEYRAEPVAQYLADVDAATAQGTVFAVLEVEDAGTVEQVSTLLGYVLEWDGHGTYLGTAEQVTAWEHAGRAAMNRRTADVWEGSPADEYAHAMRAFRALPTFPRAVAVSDYSALPGDWDAWERIGRDRDRLSAAYAAAGGYSRMNTRDRRVIADDMRPADVAQRLSSYRQDAYRALERGNYGFDLEGLNAVECPDCGARVEVSEDAVLAHTIEHNTTETTREALAETLATAGKPKDAPRSLDDVYVQHLRDFHADAAALVRLFAERSDGAMIRVRRPRAILAAIALAAALAACTPTSPPETFAFPPRCAEDETMLRGVGDFSHGRYARYECVHPDALARMVWEDAGLRRAVRQYARSMNR